MNSYNGAVSFGLLMRRLGVSICLWGKIFTSAGWYVVAGKTSRV